MVYHTSKPPWANRLIARIGTAPNSYHAKVLRELASYNRDYWGHGQVYTFTGPGHDTGISMMNPDHDHYQEYGEHVEFPVILHSSPKTDTTNAHRQLCGVLMPWYMVPHWYLDHYPQDYVKVSWRHLYDSVTVNRQLYRGATTYPNNWATQNNPRRIVYPHFIRLHNYKTPNMFIDWDCRTSGVTNLWDDGNSATLTKDSTKSHSGPKSLKIARTGVNNPYASGPMIFNDAQIVAGADYFMSVHCAGDGNAYPQIKCGGDTLGTGTSSTSWQQITSTFTAGGTTLDFYAVTSTGTEYCNFDSFYLHELGKFRYEPDSSGEFTVGFIRVERMRVAALSIFTAPDQPLTDAQAIVTAEDVAPGRAIRGYTGTGQGSIGDLEYLAGKGGAAYDVDDVERDTRRCLFQSGHPQGISTIESSSYVNIRGGFDSYFKVTPRNLTGKASGNVSTIPACYGYCQGAGVANQAYVKYTALTSGDTWTYEITSDTAAIWGDMTTLDVNATGDYVKVEYKAPPNGYIVMRSYSIWEDSYDS